MRAAPGPVPGVFVCFRGSCLHGGTVQGDSVASVAAFLLDAARGGVSANTVVQVLQHWVDEGLGPEKIRAAVTAADASGPAKHRVAFDGYRDAIATQFLSPGDPQ